MKKKIVDSNLMISHQRIMIIFNLQNVQINQLKYLSIATKIYNELKTTDEDK